MIIAVSIVVGVVVAVLLFRSFFADMDDFWECLSYRSYRSILSVLFSDDTEETWWNQMKGNVYLALAAGSGISTYFILHNWFG